MQKIDSFEKELELLKKEGIDLVQFFAEEALRNYKEPKRTGTSKGKSIGFSMKKRRAVLFMLLYPKFMRLKEIAKISGTSEGVLRVWRTQEEFRNAGIKVADAFANFLINYVEIVMNDLAADRIKTYGKDGFLIQESKNEKVIEILKSKNKKGLIDRVLSSSTKKVRVLEIDDSKPVPKAEKKFREDFPVTMTDLVPFFGRSIYMPFYEFIFRKAEEALGFGDYALLTLRARRATKVHDEPSLEKWNNQRWLKDLRERYINDYLDLLIDPQFREKVGDEEIKRIGQKLRDLIT